MRGGGYAGKERAKEEILFARGEFDLKIWEKLYNEMSSRQ